MVLEDYDIGLKVGQGGFATVYRARHRETNRDVAIKVIDKCQGRESEANSPQTPKYQELRQRIENEILIHSSLHHKHIVELVEWFEDEEYFYIVQEYCSEGNLYRLLKSYGQFFETVSIEIIRQVLLALQYMHRKGVIHRDLKLSNLLLAHLATEIDTTHESALSPDQITVKLCDFGFAISHTHPDEEHYTLCGTPNYIAPEIVRKSTAYSFKVDLWSVGILFYTLCVGQAPFEQQGVADTLQAIAQGEYKEPMHLSPLSRDFLRSLLTLDPAQRPDVSKALQHPLFTPAYDTHNASALTLPSRQGGGLSLTFSSTEGTHPLYNSPQRLSKGHSKRSAESKNVSVMSSIESQCVTCSRNSALEASSLFSLQKLCSLYDIPALKTNAMRSSYDMASISKPRPRKHMMDAVRQSYPPTSYAKHSSSLLSTATKPSSLPLPFSFNAHIEKILASLHSNKSFLLLTKQGEVALFSKSKQALCFLCPLGHSAHTMRLICDAEQEALLIDVLEDQEVVSRVKSKHPAHMLSSVFKFDVQMDEETEALFGVTSRTKILPFTSIRTPSSASSSLDKMLSKVLKRIAVVLKGIERHVPRLVVYFPRRGGREGMKCMIMSNEPLPDFHIQFQDGVILRYTLQTGEVYVKKTDREKKALFWQGKLFDEAGRSCSAVQEVSYIPEVLQKYLAAAQKALIYCMKEYDKYHDRSDPHYPQIVVATVELG